MGLERRLSAQERVLLLHHIRAQSLVSIWKRLQLPVNSDLGDMMFSFGPRKHCTHMQTRKHTHTHTTKIKSEVFFSAWSWEGLPRSCPDHGAIGQLVAAGGGVCFSGCLVTGKMTPYPHGLISLSGLFKKQIKEIGREK